jgi:asparagine synthase (glutamine-hydrolysing)
MRTEDGDVVLVFAGEDFPEATVPTSLRSRGHEVNGDGPSYLVHLFEEDDACLTRLNGRFHGVVADRRDGAATLFVDRYGMHRLYYHEGKDAFYFAADVRAILAVHPERRTLNLRALGEFVSCGCVLENRTLFDGIRLLPGASAWRFRNGALERRCSYFEPSEWEQQSPLNEEAFYYELRDVFSRTLPRYFAGPEQIGLALTGGLDTRLIMAWQRATAQALPCYTYGSMFRDNHDVRIARRVAELCGQPHHVISAGQGFLSRFADYAERSVRLTNGTVRLSHVPDLYVSEKARGLAPVKLVGTYGSELLTLVPGFQPTAATELFEPGVADEVTRAAATYASLRQQNPVTFVAFCQSPWWHYGVLALEETQVTVRAPYLDNDFVRTMYRAPRTSRAERDVRLRMIAEGNPALARIPTDRGLGGDSPWLQRVARRMLFEFMYKAEYAYDYGMPPALARVDHLLSRLHVERMFLGRHKMFHFRLWYRDVLSGYVRHILLDGRTLSRPYLRRSAVESVVRGHLKGTRNHTSDIHLLLAVELVQRLFFDVR